MGQDLGRRKDGKISKLEEPTTIFSQPSSDLQFEQLILDLSHDNDTSQHKPITDEIANGMPKQYPPKEITGKPATAAQSNI
jgi:hypothetical protein